MVTGVSFLAGVMGPPGLQKSITNLTVSALVNSVLRTILFENFSMTVGVAAGEGVKFS